MVLNCKDVKDSYNPCLKCDSCIKIMDKNLTDIMEIDAASHNGVDDIRSIFGIGCIQPGRCKVQGVYNRRGAYAIEKCL